MIVRTRRLLIRPFRPEDLPEVHRLLYADARVADWWTGLARDYSEVRERFVNDPVWRSDDGFGFRAVTLQSDGTLLGLMGFQKYRPDDDTSYVAFQDPADHIGRFPGRIEVELTYALGHEHWGHGYATEAGKALIAHGFADLGIRRIVNAVAAANAHSVRLMMRLGFRLEPNRRPDRDGPGIIGVFDRETLDIGGAPRRPLDTGEPML